MNKHKNIDKNFIINHIITKGKNIGLTYRNIFDRSYIKCDSGCWEWTTRINCAGYGLFRICKKEWLAHRISYVLYIDDIKDNLFVLHKCDNRKCVNPEHLFLGFSRDNVIDCINKGRFNRPKGQNHIFSKLTNDKVLKIRAMYKSNQYTMRDLSKIFKVSCGGISDIINKKSWSHI